MSEIRKQWLTDFIADVRQSVAEAGFSNKHAYMVQYQKAIQDPNLDEIHPVLIQGTYNKLNYAVDGYVYNEDEEKLTLAIIDFHEFAQTSPLRTEDIQRLTNLLKQFIGNVYGGESAFIHAFTLDIAEHTREYELLTLLQAFFKTASNPTISLNFFTDKDQGKGVKQIKDERLLCHSNGRDIEIILQYRIWTMDKLLDSIDKVDGDDLIFDFSDAPIPVMEAVSGQGYTTYLGVMDARKLAELFYEHKSSLLEQNVRSYLKLTNKVNKGIKETIQNEPESFFIFNNGITVTTHGLKKVDGKVVAMRGLQIINGGQTTATLAKVLYDSKNKPDFSSIRVPLKLTVFDKEVAPARIYDLVEKISICSNSQSKVDLADLSSNHKFHLLFEEKAKRIPIPSDSPDALPQYWFYERSKCSFDQLKFLATPAQRRRIDKQFSKSRKVTKIEIIRVLLAWEEKPWVISKGTTYAFNAFNLWVKPEGDEEQIHLEDQYDDVFYKETIGKRILFRSLHSAISKQPWYKTKYSSTVGPITHYTLSILHRIMQRQYPGYDLNFLEIWNKQAVPEKLLAIVLDLAEYTSEVILTRPNKTSYMPGLEFAKREECYEHLCEAIEQDHYTLPELRAYLQKVRVLKKSTS